MSTPCENEPYQTWKNIAAIMKETMKMPAKKIDVRDVDFNQVLSTAQKKTLLSGGVVSITDVKRTLAKANPNREMEMRHNFKFTEATRHTARFRAMHEVTVLDNQGEEDHFVQVGWDGDNREDAVPAVYVDGVKVWSGEKGISMLTAARLGYQKGGKIGDLKAIRQYSAEHRAEPNYYASESLPGAISWFDAHYTEITKE